MIRVPKIEMHLAHSCNLRCEGCSHFSNYGLSGLVRIQEGGPWLTGWAERIEPVHFTFLGGEPLLNTDLLEYLRLARALWSHTWIRVATNGLLLPRWGDRLWSTLAETRTLLSISIHSREKEYRERMSPIRNEAKLQAGRYGFAVEERNSVDTWYRLYKGYGRDMTPFNDGNAQASWAVCENKHCVTLQDNCLWKCPPVAHLSRIAEKFGFAKDGPWRAGLSYRALSLDASDEDMRAFFARKWESVCGMCPAKLEYFEKSI